MTFLPEALRLNKQEVVDKIMSTKFPDQKYLPRFACMHNAGIPSLAMWDNWSEAKKFAFGDNLNHFYKTLGWHSAPCAMGTPEDWSFQLCGFGEDNVHASCFNKVDNKTGWSWGVETVGDFREGGDDPTSSRGKASVDSTINILAAMHLLMNWDPGDYEYAVKGLHFHLECEKDHHPCPGNLIHKADIILRIKSRMSEIKNEQDPPKVVPVEINIVGTATINPISPASQPTISVAPNSESKIVITPWPYEEEYPKFFADMKLYYNTILNLAKDWPNKNCIAAGDTANVEAECAFKLVEGDKASGGAFGFHQYHMNRVAAILKGCNIDVRTASVVDQAKAFWWEIHNLETKTLTDLQSVRSALDAAQVICRDYERAGAANAMQRRGLMAERIAVHFNK
jgi:hypothetical protein